MQLKLHFDMDSAAFDEDAPREAAAVLEQAARLIRRGVTASAIRDLNGNTIGEFAIKSRSRTEAARKAALTRAANQSPERRSAIARAAAQARWGKRRGAAS